jgi:hypothetical protein
VAFLLIAKCLNHYITACSEVPYTRTNFSRLEKTKGEILLSMESLTQVGIHKYREAKEHSKCNTFQKFEEH